MRYTFAIVLTIALVDAFRASHGDAAALAGTARDPAVPCSTLARQDFSQVLDAPTRIVDATAIAASEDTPASCQVVGYVTPSVGFTLRLPSAAWNGKLLELGCGGFCGSTDHIVMCDEPLRRGYACVVSDNGHRSTPRDGVWAFHNLQAEIDHAYRAAHVTALAGKAIVGQYYGQPARRSYFSGCSTGGRQALREAQQFPWDFDGIIAGAPSLDVPGIYLHMLWGNRALIGRDGSEILNEADIDLLHSAVMRKCDLDDGVEDGLIEDPRRCSFAPEELRCVGAATAGCLTPRQIAAVEKLYDGPMTSTGERVSLPGPMKGSEKTWLTYFRGPASNPRQVYDFAADVFRYSAFQPSPGPAWRAEDFDFDRDYKRLGASAALYAANNPDLRRFKGAGGKLLSYVGWNDAIGMPLPVIDYYETVERTLGSREATQDFFRLFVIPGMNHCTGGDGAFGIDYLSHLETWVEQGQAPDKVVGSHVRVDDLNIADPDYQRRLRRRTEFPLDPATVEFTKTIYSYPELAGKTPAIAGLPDDGKRWYRCNTHTHTSAPPKSDANGTPAAVADWYERHGYQCIVITDHEFLTDVTPLNRRHADGAFLALRGQEITQSMVDPEHPQGVRHLHVNGFDINAPIMPVGYPERARGRSAAEIYERNLAAIAAAGGLAQINHPNLQWSVRLEDLLPITQPYLLEIWNAYPTSNNLGGVDDTGRAAMSAEALWDGLLSKGRIVWGVASDDAHEYQKLDSRESPTPGKAWIALEAGALTAPEVMNALRAGRFYASTGVSLDRYAVDRQSISIHIAPVQDWSPALTSVTRFVTRFIGRDGRVLQEVTGSSPTYRFRGDEGYVRASILDSDGRRAWTQPVFVDRRDRR